MACNCSKNKVASASWVHTNSKGQKRTYDSEIKARAAQIREGGNFQRVAG